MSSVYEEEKEEQCVSLSSVLFKENLFSEHAKPLISLTGDRPSGPLHLGHYVGSLINRLKIQEHGHTQYIMLADIQALTDNFRDPSRVTSAVFEVLRDYLAVGLSPECSTIFLQSCVPELSELTIYYMNLVSVGRLERNPTVKEEIFQKGYGHTIPAGFLCYPISQAADITAFQADLVPVGEDQIPMIEQTNEIVRKFNRIYETNVLKTCQAYIGSTGRLIGINGKAKASKSLNNAIFLKDDSETIQDKIFSMYTDPLHIHVSDPGQVEGNVVFNYLQAFHPDQKTVESLECHYRKGGLGDRELKHILNQVLQDLLKPIREKRLSYKDSELREILMAGTHRARKVAQTTLKAVRDAIGLNGYEKESIK
jgi:tryptophanyl-tRNA synthetase